MPAAMKMMSSMNDLGYWRDRTKSATLKTMAVRTVRFRCVGSANQIGISWVAAHVSQSAYEVGEMWHFGNSARVRVLVGRNVMNSERPGGIL